MEQYYFSQQAKLPTDYGMFNIQAVRGPHDKEHAILVKGNIQGRDFVPVRIHSECLTGDAFSSLKCDCRYQLNYALEYIATLGFGVLIYLRQEGRGIGLFNKINAYCQQDNGKNTIEANEAIGFQHDLRDYTIGAHLIQHLELHSICLMTNNPNKITALEQNGVNISRRIPIVPKSNQHNEHYLAVKKNQLFHLL